MSEFLIGLAVGLFAIVGYDRMLSDWRRRVTSHLEKVREQILRWNDHVDRRERQLRERIDSLERHVRAVQAAMIAYGAERPAAEFDAFLRDFVRDHPPEAQP